MRKCQAGNDYVEGFFNGYGELMESAGAVLRVKKYKNGQKTYKLYSPYVKKVYKTPKNGLKRVFSATFSAPKTAPKTL